MGRKILIAAVAAIAITGGSAYAGSRWIVTSIGQIKPTVLAHFQRTLAFADKEGPTAYMCPNGTDTTGQCEVAASDARCPGASTAMGGGWDGGSSPPLGAFAGYNQADLDGRGWHVIMGNGGSGSTTFSAMVVCLGVAAGAAKDASATVPASVRTQIGREVAAMRAR